MAKKLVFLFSFILVLGIAGQGRAELLAHWKLDEDSGTIAADSVGSYNGTLRGGPVWVSGIYNGALQFDGSDDCVEVGSYPVFNAPEGSFSVALWANIEDWSGEWLHSMIGNRSDGVGWCLRRWGSWWVTSQGYTQSNQALSFTTRGIGHVADDVEDSPSETAPPLNEWIHIACLYDSENNMKYIYFNGVLDAAWETNPETITPATQRFYIGARSNAGDSAPEAYFTGKLDEVRFYNHPISEEEIEELTAPPITVKAKDPNPLNGFVMVNIPQLSWTAADVAALHDVYFGTDPNLGQADYQGRQESNTYTAVIAADTTYYWRIDEIEADGVTIHTGNVWSFTTGPATAFNPNPADGDRWILADADLNWISGVNAATHDVYFGTSQGDVAAGSGDTFKGNQTAAGYDPGTMAADTTYYWRIDEVQADGTTKYEGSVWRFRTAPVISVTDPNLVGWWTLDEGQGLHALDWSGHGNHGTVMGNPQWVAGFNGGALDFDGAGDYVDCGNSPMLNIRNQITMSVWFKIAAFVNDWEAIISKGDNAFRLSRSATNGNATHIGVNGTTANYFDGTAVVANDEWHHIAGVYDGAQAIIYVDGAADVVTPCTGQINDTNDRFFIGENSVSRGRYSNGIIDDVRLYNRALTQDEIKLVMRGDTIRAWNSQPANGATTDIEKASSLSWTPGDNAVRHDVYLGNDALTLEDAGISDTTGIYRGRQDANSYTPPEGLVPGATYYWRVDEINADATISKGRIWSFTLAEYLIVDDFEQYNDTTNRIYDIWADYFVNNTGMTVGHLRPIAPPYAERAIVHGGSQSMYMTYDNDGTVNEGSNYEQSGTLFYSEAERQWDDVQDWTRQGVTSLTLWFRGISASMGSFTPGTSIYRMTAAGADIWGEADEFHFAYKQLTGIGNVIAKVVSVSNTDPWAKAGVMIRETLDPGSKHAMMVVSPNNGIAFQRRVTADAASEGTNKTGLIPPYWVRVSRMGNTIYGEMSADGKSWETLGTVTMPMLSTVYVGLCLTSHNVEQMCTAEFSNVAINGNVTGQWQSQDIGIQSNSAEQLYVALQDSSGQSAVVKYPDPASSVINQWTQWNIMLADITGVNLRAIKKMSIGIGDRASTQPGSSGIFYVDDIGLGFSN
jgi:regulation of enolase protein 1 (concanavalin A-like superfamily)